MVLHKIKKAKKNLSLESGRRRNKIIHLNARQKLNVVVHQMFLKELLEQRNSALKYCREYITNNPDVQTKLEYPATLKSRQKGSHGKWEILKDF